MNFLMEGRSSDSPYVEMIWRGWAGNDYAPTCPADERWDMLFLKRNGKVRISVEGPLTKATPKTQTEGTEWLVIRFKLGAFMPSLPVSKLVDIDAVLPEAARKSFWLHGSIWQIPDYENVEAFIDRLVDDDLLFHDPVVNAVLQNQSQEISSRTVRRRFLRATGLTYKTIEQIQRAQQAAALLEGGVSLVDTVYQAGYADQAHMTRSLKRFIGQTPAQIAHMHKPE
jgi:AraC-like DNA-binding protein